MRILTILLLGLLLVGCSGNKLFVLEDWHCQSDIKAVAEACTRAQTNLMKDRPKKCVRGAKVNGGIVAKDSPKLDNTTRYNSGAEIECN